MPTVDENFVKRIQPHSEEAERSVLGSMLMDRDAIVEAEDILTKEDFYQRQYGIVFEAMVELYREGKAVDAKFKNAPAFLNLRRRFFLLLICL